jgi:hypothetical protein
MAAVFLTKQVVTSNGRDYGGFYEDRIARDIYNGDLYFDVRGQRLGKRDRIVEQAHANGQPIHLFARNRQGTYRYYGIADHAATSIVQRAAPLGVDPGVVEGLAFYHFVIQQQHIHNGGAGVVVPRDPAYGGYWKNKAPCIAMLVGGLGNIVSVGQTCFEAI